jgi:hypothetical protein
MRSRTGIVAVFLSIAAGCVWPAIGCAQAAGAVANTIDLLRLLSKAGPGQVIRMKAGVYAHVVINGFRGSVTLTSFDPAHPAVLTDLTIKNSSGLILKTLELDNSNYPIGPFGPMNTMAFQVLNSENITMSHLDIHGSKTGTLATDESGLFIRFSKHIMVEFTDFHNLNNALQHGDDEWLIVRGNHFHHLRDDGLRGGGSSNVLVEGNHCDSNHPDGAADKDHPDCIQFWTSNTKQSAHDITIVGNTYQRGSGTPTQGVWMRDEVGNLPFHTVIVSKNVIEGGGYNGVTVFGAVDVKMSDNTVCQYRDQPSWLSIRQVDGAVVIGNAASRINYIKSSHVKQSGNRTIADCTPASISH